MTITQTVEIPASHKLTIDVPRERPTGRTQVVIQFPVVEKQTDILLDLRKNVESDIAQRFDAVITSKL